MKVKEFIEKLNALHPNDDTDLDFLLVDLSLGLPLYDFLDVEDILRNADCSRINAIGVNFKLSHRLSDDVDMKGWLYEN